MAAKVDSKEVGLVAGLNLFHFFLGTRDLHYGLWGDDLEVNIRNLPQAQERYTELLVGHIPDGVERILDVGCGAGGVAAALRARGYRVEGVSPSPLLTEAARQNVGDDFKIHEGRFEDIAFSESVQYITLDRVLDDARARLEPGGHVLICDFFKTGAPGRSIIGGGHKLDRFRAVLEASPFAVIEDIDITRETAPNLDIVEQMGRELMLPTGRLIGYFLDRNYPWLARLLRWKYRKKLARIERKYLSGERNGANFARHKNYRLLLLRLSE